MDKKLIVEKLEPPLFTRTGIYIEREEAWKKGIEELHETAEPGGTFCYTFFKGRGTK